MEQVWLTATIWMGLAVVASIISVRTAVSVALIEICVGVIGGNYLHLQTTEWINFLAGFGSVLLTFMAGAEIEPEILRKYFKESISIGFVSFLLPFVGAMAYAHYVAHWTTDAAKICGIALSTTSVAVVYAVMVETGLNQSEFGKLILAACFITDLGTVVALGILFANYNWLLLGFVVAMLGSLWIVPGITRRFADELGGHVSEPETKLIFLILFALGALAVKAKSEAVLPAYLIGLSLAAVLRDHRQTVRHMRTTVFALLTPFYFIKAGSIISIPALISGAALVAVLLIVKVAMKFLSVWPLTRAFKFSPSDGMYTTLLMSTGLTFGSISALYGYTNHYINQAQYTILVTVVIGSAIVPTIIAQSFFKPKTEEVESLNGVAENPCS
ncbi:MAG: potassium transporter Kef [Armatimonadetes bacterium CG2_30_59_28]|nr:cation:proton antiporter [Armatimonadota bacterium]OIO89421.1 MAG: potassium transporter Kef [Armatimonadetes bacterium CG2_30_59_28]PIU64032.1 MAG: potassium transporter Kef [Armatimonadetes bacterium CG07_land_8_20_14_0_80_59_28]PIY46919.1 MAG: potassium transporter Kef [Armatimonadetes bacterium CG_4_10_14_3_um_filter_59_10]